MKAVFDVEWKDGMPDFKKTPVTLTGYSAMAPTDHNGASPIECQIEASEAEIEELKDWLKFKRYVPEDELI
jgi:hypothetical protein